MTLRSIFFWFWSTLLIGAVTSLLFSPFLHVHHLIPQILAGLTLAAIAELGFFSYLLFNWICRGYVRNLKVFSLVLISLILLVVLNFVYLSIHQSIAYYPTILCIILGTAITIAYIKSHQTHFGAFLPTLFLMIVMSIMEALPAFQIRSGHASFIIALHTVSVILVCNAWQILQLHHWVSWRNK